LRIWEWRAGFWARISGEIVVSTSAEAALTCRLHWGWMWTSREIWSCGLGEVSVPPLSIKLLECAQGVAGPSSQRKREREREIERLLGSEVTFGNISQEASMDMDQVHCALATQRPR
jgi:hypothetical protein